MVAPRALVFRPLVKGNEDSGNEIEATTVRHCTDCATVGPMLALDDYNDNFVLGVA